MCQIINSSNAEVKLILGGCSTLIRSRFYIGAWSKPKWREWRAGLCFSCGSCCPRFISDCTVRLCVLVYNWLEIVWTLLYMWFLSNLCVGIIWKTFLFRMIVIANKTKTDHLNKGFRMTWSTINLLSHLTKAITEVQYEM